MVALGVGGTHGVGHFGHVYFQWVDTQVLQPGKLRQPLGQRRQSSGPGVAVMPSRV